MHVPHISTIKASARELMGNKELIALNQNDLGLQAYVVQHSGDTYILVKDVDELYGNTRAVAFYNPSDVAVEMSLPYVDIDLGGKMKVRDLYEHKELQTANSSILTVTVPAHGTRIYRVEGEKRYERALYEAETAYLTDYQELVNNQSAVTGVYDALTNASGGMVAGWLGCKSDNDLQWRNVYSKDGGEYTMTLNYISGANRKTKIQVNGSDVSTQTLNSGGWSTIKGIDIPVTLKAGENVIRLYTDGTDWMPNFDCMTIYKTGSSDQQSRAFESAKANLMGIDLTTVTRAMADKINGLVNTDTSGMSETEIASLTTTMTSTLSAAKAMQTNCSTWNIWKTNTEKNINASAFSSSLTTLQTSVEKAQASYDESLTNAAVSTALSKLKTALKTYLKAEDAEPIEGDTLDMTLLLSNPDFSGTTGWIGSPTYNYGVGEFWNKSFSLYQSLTGMKNGKYVITCNALYRKGENDSGSAYKAGTETTPAFFYANTDSVRVSSIYSALYYDQNCSSSLDMKNGYANSMYAASQMFSRGNYLNTLNATVADGKLKIGIISSNTTYDNWCCFDDFHIYYTIPRRQMGTIYGDVNNDGSVDISDVNAVIGIICGN